jgi:hypothetical protein
MLENTVNKLLASDSEDRKLYTSIWVLLDLLYYILNLAFNEKASIYETCILGLLDMFLYWTKDEKDKLRTFHSLPKVFLVHLRNPVLLTAIAIALFGLHAWQQLKASRSVVFFAVIALAVFLASFGVSKIVALAFVTGIMASYMYLWESIEPQAPKEEPQVNFDQLTQHNDDPHMKDQAIAQDLVSKLKRLKVAIIYEQEKIRRHAIVQAEKLRQPQRRIKRTRSRSVAESKDNSDKDLEKEEDLVKKNMLELEDLKQLIEILVSHNSQEMKYWLPKDILSVLNNEEVSAYLWAYLNTQDMIPSPRAVKKLISKVKSEAGNLHLGSSIGEDFNFDLFTFDQNNIHQDSLVIGCSQIFSKFK